MPDPVLDHPLIAARYFFPARAKLSHPFWVEAGPARLACFYHRPHPEAKTLVHFHGNGEVVADHLADLVPALEQLGYNCLLAEYRGYGQSTGVPALGAMLADVEPIIKSLHLPPEKLVLFGRSVGSIFALEAAARFPSIAGLILESGIADPLERLLLRVRPEELGLTFEQFQAVVARDLNHPAKLARYRGATLILHTRHDGLVEVTHARRLFEWAPEPKKLHIFEQGNHNTIMFSNFQEYFRQVQTFIDSLPE
ncbi:MAG TPA: alpha/beta fold hydrolase [Anaerolineae bacterium]|nr:alpha/beta fold hydrolase [Anaerolineae bacterium]